MTWNYESFWVVPHNWQEWIKRYPKVELRWMLRVVFDSQDKRWKIIEGDYRATARTRLDAKYLEERFDDWKDAVDRAHDLVSTVATSHMNQTWPEAKALIESQEDPVLF